MTRTGVIADEFWAVVEPVLPTAKTYAERNTVERGFSRLKQWRGIATRYDRVARAFPGGVLLAASTCTCVTKN